MIWSSSECWVARWASWICDQKSIKALINNFHHSLHNSWQGGGRGGGGTLLNYLSADSHNHSTSVWQNTASDVWWKKTQATFDVITNYRRFQSTKEPVWVFTGKLKGILCKKFLSLSISVIEVSLCKTWLPAPPGDCSVAHLLYPCGMWQSIFLWVRLPGNCQIGR